MEDDKREMKRLVRCKELNLREASSFFLYISKVPNSIKCRVDIKAQMQNATLRPPKKKKKAKSLKAGVVSLA